MNIPFNNQPCRNHSKHWSPRFKWLRGKKVIHVDLPNYQEKEEEIAQEERNRRMKERGVLPARPWTERPIILSAVSIEANIHSNLTLQFIFPYFHIPIDKFDIRAIRSTRR